MPSTTSGILPGTRIYKYELLQRIGQGSFGDVWHAIDHAVNHEFAIKVIETGDTVHEKLIEAHVGHQLDHRNVVRVHHADVARLGGKRFVILAMDYVKGGSSLNLANPSGYLTLPDVLRIIRDVLQGLEYLHIKNFIHNDIKPENVLIGSDGRGLLTDYGIVGVNQGTLQLQSSLFYKIHAAPEVITLNTTGVKSDIYQVGLTMFRMLSGLDSLRRKFNELGEHDYYEVVAGSGLLNTPDFPAYIPPRLKKIILRASHVDPSRRYSSALAMRRELEKLQYPGYWTVTDGGDFLGLNGAYEYRYEQTLAEKGRFDVFAYKKSTRTKRETKSLKFCHRSLSNSEAKKAIEKFVKTVVEGKL